jgi:hypothetical protein
LHTRRRRAASFVAIATRAQRETAMKMKSTSLAAATLAPLRSRGPMLLPA